MRKSVVGLVISTSFFVMQSEIDTPAKDALESRPEFFEKWLFGLSIEEAKTKSANPVDWDEYTSLCLQKYGQITEKKCKEVRKRIEEDEKFWDDALAVDYGIP
jgi:hypothetical protein